MILAVAMMTAMTAASAKNPAGEIMLQASDLDPAAILPAPPARDSAQARRELDELHDIERTRRPEDVAAARADSEAKNASIFAEAVGPGFDLARLPATAHLFAIVRETEKDEADRGKDEFKRARPWIVDPRLQSCSRDDDDLSSYPSGHATMAYSMAAVLARLVPERAPAIMARAARYGEARLVCEVHFRSDVTAGEALGMVVAERLMEKPAFRAVFDASRDELRKAGIAR
jgi:acid phosphatase (class A)